MAPSPSPTVEVRRAIGERLLLERRRQGLSQKDIALALETDQKVVSRAELGKSTIETQFRVAAVLGIDLLEPST